MTRRCFRKLRLRLEILERRDVPSFVTAPSYQAANVPEKLAVGDIDGDVDIDIVVLSEDVSGDFHITPMFGDGSGVFSTGTTVPVANYSALAAADVTGDGKLDLLGNDFIVDAVDVLVGNGDGTFESPVSYPSNQAEIGAALTTADFNGDGHIDVAFSNVNGAGVSILMNTGGGIFQAPLDHTGSQIFDLEVGDVNNDGKIDIVGAGYEDLHVLLGNGDGTFQSTIFNTTSVHSSLELADFNGDGKLDVAVPSDFGPSNVVFMRFGNGDGTFANGTTYPAGLNPQTLVAADFDGDGDADLAVNAKLNNGDVTITVLRNTLGTFRRRVTYVASGVITHLVGADFNADGRTDIAAATRPDDVTILMAEPGGMLIAASAIPTSPAPTIVQAADLSGDGDLDLITDPFRVFAGGSGANFKLSATNSATLFWTSGAILDHVMSDIDGDGDLDAVLEHQNSGPYPLSLWKNQGNGTFLNPPTYSLGTTETPAYGAVGDVNNDGHLDVITAAATRVYVFKGNGDGTLQAVTSFPSGSQSVGVATAHVNADGLLDIIVTNRQPSGTVSVLLGTGGGNFGPATSFPVGHTPVGIRVADFDGDGDTDIAVANSASHNVSVLLSNNDGTFAPAIVTPVGGTSPRNLALGDFNIDGRLDLATANSGSDNISVLFGNGDGTFSPPTTYATNAAPKDVDVADLNGDGLVDLAVISGLVGATDILRGNGDGTFQAPTTIAGPSDGHNLEIGDYNADGMLDIVVAYPFASVGFYQGNGDGTFKSLVPYVGGSSPIDVVSGDMNHDGILDLAVPNILFASSVRIMPGSTSGFQAIQLVNIFTPNDYVLADLNSDGAVDLATTASDGLRVRPNPGDGTFVPFVFYPLGGADTIVVGDFNEDGISDLAVAHNPDINGMSVSILMGNGDGTFQSPVGIISSSTPDELLVADFNNDGNLDLAASNLGSALLNIALGNGDGTFSVLTSSVLGGKRALVVADFNNDDIVDLAATAVVGTTSIVGVMLGNGDGTFQAASTYGAGKDAMDLTAGDFDQDGWIDIAVVDNADNFGTPKLIILRNDGIWPPLPIGDGPDTPTRPRADHLVSENGTSTSSLAYNALPSKVNQAVAANAGVSELVRMKFASARATVIKRLADKPDGLALDID